MNVQAAFADQGLLYHWVKYVQKDVSIVGWNGLVYNWGSLPNGTVHLEQTLHEPCKDYTNRCFGKICDKAPPRKSFFHFSGPSKPWLSRPPNGAEEMDENAPSFWWRNLFALNADLRFGLVFETWVKPEESTLGGYPTYLQALSAKTNLLEVVTPETRKNVTDDQTRSRKVLTRWWELPCHFSLDDINFNGTIPRYAIAFFVGGCDHQHPSYRSYLYNILVAVRILRNRCSKAEFIVFFQFSATSEASSLPEAETRWLREMNISIRYIPKQLKDNFYRSQLEKFRILGLTQYSRVLFMDADVMPLGNLDYLFYLSETGVLKSNVVFKGKYEPASGDFFILKPGNLEQLNGIIEKREQEALDSPFPHFDKRRGWGHTIQPPDEWNAKFAQGKEWTFPAAFADQGLLYHWVKYVQKDVSIIGGTGVSWNWGSEQNGTLRFEGVEASGLKKFSRPLKCFDNLCRKGPPRADFFHFGGFRKGRNNPLLYRSGTKRPLWSGLNDAVLFWWENFEALNKELKMDLVLDRVLIPMNTTLGSDLTYSQAVNAQTNLLTECIEAA